jgi:hypothetical protein
VRCERCGAPLLVLKGRATAVSVGLVLVAAATAGLALVKSAALLKADIGDAGPLTIFLAVWLLFLWAQTRIAPRLCQVRTLRGGESVFFPLDQ